MRKLITSDIFAGIRLMSKLDIKEEMEKTMLVKGRSVEQVGFDIIYQIIIKCSEKNFEQAFYDFISAPLEVKPSAVAGMDPMELVDKIYEIASPEEWVNFFERVRKLNHRKG